MIDQVILIKLLITDKFFAIAHPPFLDYVYERNIKNPDIRDHLWKYRPAITLEHLIQEMEVGGHSQTYPALFYFLREVILLSYIVAVFCFY